MVRYTSGRDTGEIKPFEAMEILWNGKPSRTETELAATLDFRNDALVVESDERETAESWRLHWSGVAGAVWQAGERRRAALVLQDGAVGYEQAVAWARSKANVHAITRVAVPSEPAERLQGRGLTFPSKPKQLLPEGYRDEQAVLLEAAELELEQMRQHNGALEQAVAKATEQRRIAEDIYVADPSSQRGRAVIDARHELELAALRAERLRRDESGAVARVASARQNIDCFDRGIYASCKLVAA
jgi:hypothetical protein